MKLTLFFKFHYSYFFRSNPALTLIATILSILCAIEGIALIEVGIVQKETVEKMELIQAKIQGHQIETDQFEISNAPTVELPRFQSSKLVKSLHTIISGLDIPISEVNYSFEAQASKPYSRYKIGFMTLSQYPQLKTMLGQLKKEMPHVLLDGISCAREDMTSMDLQCDLTLSAYFQE